MFASSKLFADRKYMLATQRQLAWVCAVVQFAAFVLFGTCWLLYPDVHEVAVACGFMGIFSCLTPFIVALWTKEFRALLCGIAVFNLAPIWFLYLETVIPSYDAYIYTPPGYRFQAFLLIALFLFTTNALYTFLWAPISRLSIRSFSFLGDLKPNVRSFYFVSLFTFVFPLVAFLGYYGSPGILWQAISGGRSGGGSFGGLLISDSVGALSSLMLPINWLWQTTPFFGTLTFVMATKKKSLEALIPLLMGFAVVFAFFLSGSRGNMMYVAAPIFYYFVVYNWNKGIKFWATIIGCFFLLVGVMEMQVRFRGNLLEVITNPEKAARDNGLKSFTTIDVTESQRDNNFYLLGLILKGYPDKYEYEGFNDFVAILLNPVPRAFWPGKPVLLGAKDIAYQAPFVLDGPLYMGTTSLSYSVVGEAYKAKGIFGIIFYASVYSLIIIFFDALTVYSSRKQIIAVGLLGTSVF
ncbi:MAG: hypothetical protein AB8H12_03970, partial [Lewinella sp.]